MVKYQTKDLFPILVQFSYMTIDGYDIETAYKINEEDAWIFKPDSDDISSIIPNQEVILSDSDLIGDINVFDLEGKTHFIECARHVGISMKDILEIKS